jgi:hypothetical protein
MRRTLAIAVSLAFAASASLAADSPLRPELMRGAMGLKLGAWQTRFTVVDLEAEMPDVDAAERKRAVAEFRAELERDSIRNECLRDHPHRLRLPGVNPPEACEYSRLEARNGSFEIRSVCRAHAGATLEATVKGRYSPDRMTARSEVTSSVEGMRIRIKMDSDSRLTGECPPPPVIQTPPGKAD